MAPTALSSSATFAMSTSPELSASAKEFVPGEAFAGVATLGSGFHFDPSACEFNPSMMALPQPMPTTGPMSLINFSDYSSDDDDDESPPPVTKTPQKEALAKEEVKSSTKSNNDQSKEPEAETANELCKGDIAMAPWKRAASKEKDAPKSPAAKSPVSPKSPASKVSLKSPASKDSPKSPNSKDTDSRPWRKSSAANGNPEASKPWRPWHNKLNKEEEDNEAVSANLSDASTETPVSTTGASTAEITPKAGEASPKSMSNEMAEDADSEGPSPCSSSGDKESPLRRLTAGLGGYLGPQRARAVVPGTMSVAEMMRWRTAASDLKPDNFTYFMDVVDMPEVPLANSGASKNSKGGNWRDNRSSRTTKRATNPKQEDEGSWREEDVAPLQKSENSWAARQELRRSKKNLNPDGKTDEEIVRAMKSILNKLTIEKYDKLYLQMLNTGISTVQHVKILIHEVMEKAQTQHHFIEMYSTFCVHLHEWFNENQVSDDPKTGFKRILLNECQSLFESCLKQQDTSNLQAEEVEEAKAKYKLIMLGNIKFVGSLLGKRMLATSVLVAIAEDLISEPCSPEALEALAVFLTSVGGTFDRPDWQHHKRLDAIFDQLEAKKSDKKVPARIRFLIQDVLDLRASGWEDQKKATKKNEGPMKLEDVHEKASQEELAKSQWTETKGEWRENPWRDTRSSKGNWWDNH
eukprot:gnl/MRDRNA2_/MRDRNA2_27766_c0_seq1.p1 gnl/MRDRNA2_/MRDRNA2_27766_c0~~gnl/MRDRNA2_/MRDRNA2_27766_c0_seq1.p1  ORF type:complete len:693 (-),score=177.78 gnl/MRDRNA2_/MRDRNA2_27766_c0_seq1:134-2212(-)